MLVWRQAERRCSLAVAFRRPVPVLVNDRHGEQCDRVVDESGATGAARRNRFRRRPPATRADRNGRCRPVDVLVNNAWQCRCRRLQPGGPGSPRPGPPTGNRSSGSTTGAARTRAVLPAMVANSWGRVTIVSNAGRAGDPGGAVYGATKAAAAGLTRSIVWRTGGSTSPPTSHWHHAHTDDRGTVVRARGIHPRPRPFCRVTRSGGPGCPTTSRSLALLLGSDHGSWITGQRRSASTAAIPWLSGGPWWPCGNPRGLRYRAIHVLDESSAMTDADIAEST